MNAPLDDGAWRRRRYLDEGASTREIAREVGRDRKTVRTALRRHGIPARPPGRVTPPAVRPGDRFGRLVVVAEAPRERRSRPKERAYVCACDCGGEKVVGRGPLRAGAVLSCGCLRRKSVAYRPVSPALAVSPALYDHALRTPRARRRGGGPVVNERLAAAEARCVLALAEGRVPSPRDEAPLIEAVRAVDPRPEVRLLLLARFQARREAAVERARGQLTGSRLTATAGSGATSGMSGRGLGVASLVEELGAAWAPRKGERNGLPAE